MKPLKHVREQMFTYDFLGVNEAQTMILGENIHLVLASPFVEDIAIRLPPNI
jgi:hypothetical protein